MVSKLAGWFRSWLLILWDKYMVWNFIRCFTCIYFILYNVCYVSACTVLGNNMVSFVNKVGNCSNDQHIGWNKLASVHPAGFVSVNKLASVHPASFEAVPQPVSKQAIIFQWSWIGPTHSKADRPASKWASRLWNGLGCESGCNIYIYIYIYQQCAKS